MTWPYVQPPASRASVGSLPSNALEDSNSAHSLTLLGLPTHIETVKQQCYQLQGLLASDEKSCSIAAINSSSDVSDDAISSQTTVAAVAGRWLPQAINTAPRHGWLNEQTPPSE